MLCSKLTLPRKQWCVSETEHLVSMGGSETNARKRMREGEGEALSGLEVDHP